MFLLWNLLSVLFILLFFTNYGIAIVDAFDQNCQPEDSRRCVIMSTIRATFDKRANNQGTVHTEDDQLAIQSNDRLGDLLDLNSEPAVEDLMRQIMSQAKLWEAIQEANREMILQKSEKHRNAAHFPFAFSSQ